MPGGALGARVRDLVEDEGELRRRRPRRRRDGSPQEGSHRARRGRGAGVCRPLEAPAQRVLGNPRARLAVSLPTYSGNTYFARCAAKAHIVSSIPSALTPRAWRTRLYLVQTGMLWFLKTRWGTKSQMGYKKRQTAEGGKHPLLRESARDSSCLLNTLIPQERPQAARWSATG
jgi:hypothetical protein